MKLQDMETQDMKMQDTKMQVDEERKPVNRIDLSCWLSYYVDAGVQLITVNCIIV